MRAVSFYGFAGAYAVACKQLGVELVAVVEPGAFGSDVVDKNRDWLGFTGPIHTGPAETAPSYDDIDVLLGNPPCSAWSGLNTSKTNRGENADVSKCMWELIRYAATLNRGRGPRTVIFESVQAAGRQGRGMMRRLHAELCELTGEPYRMTHLFMSGASVGAAQIRKRYFFVATREDSLFGIVPPVVDRVATYGDAIGDLVHLELGADFQPNDAPPTWFSEPLVFQQQGEQGGWISDHVVPEDRWLKMCQELIPHWRLGENEDDAMRRFVETEGRWPETWREKEIQRSLNNTGFSKTVRVRPEKPGYVIAGDGGYGFIHWERPTFLTVREVARLMGFPDAIQWGWLKPMHAYSYLGKQVPVQSWNWALKQVIDHLAGCGGWFAGYPQEDYPERVIDVTYDFRQVFSERSLVHGQDARTPEQKAEMERRPYFNVDEPNPVMPVPQPKPAATREPRAPGESRSRIEKKIIEVRDGEFVREINGLKFLLRGEPGNSSDEETAWRLAGRDLHREVGLLRRGTLEPEDVWLDIGAHIGAFTLRAAKDVKAVIAVEPDEDNFRVLCESIRLSGLKNVLPIKAAIVTDDRTEVTFYAQAPDHIGRLSGGLVPRRNKVPVTVPAYTVAELVKEYGITKVKVEIGELEDELFMKSDWSDVQFVAAEYSFINSQDLDRAKFNPMIEHLRTVFPSVEYRDVPLNAWHTIISLSR